MKALHADPKEIRKVFTERYIVPDFQRPYSWEEEQCDKLWDDLVDFYESKSSKDDKYFLGNIVIHYDGSSFAVIDGQQRLTSLILLIKALHQRAGAITALEECLKTKDPLTSQLQNELRIESFVIDTDKVDLYDVIFNNGNNTPDTHKIKINYRNFEEKISKWWLQKQNSTQSLQQFVLMLLDQVVLLPIQCGSEDDALIIFETINNRGMSLSDADIFKAKLHRNATQHRDIFMKRWNALSEHEWLFRVYMHIVRAKSNDTNKEVALRYFFTNNQDRLKNWEEVMDCLELIYLVENSWQAVPEINSMWFILKTYPNYYWNFPLFVYLNKYGQWDDEDKFYLSEERNKEFLILITETFKYFFIKGVVYNSVNSVKDTVFKVCAAIESEGDYLKEYHSNYIQDLEEFQRKLQLQQLGRYQKGLVLLSSYLNPLQNRKEFDQLIRTGALQIEHILPKKWNNYDNWTAESWEVHINQLGNLVALEWNLNISAKNEFFDRKKKEYQNSKIQDAVDLMELSDWYPENFQARNNVVMDRLFTFFSIKELVLN